MNIYELTGAFLQIQNMIEEGHEGLEDTLESLEMALEDKVQGYIHVIKNLSSDVEGIKAEEKRLNARRKTLENNIKRLEQALETSLVASGKDKVKAGNFTVSFRKSSSVEVINEDLVPDEFVSIERKVNKTLIKDALKNNPDLEFARIVEKKNLQIK